MRRTHLANELSQPETRVGCVEGGKSDVVAAVLAIAEGEVEAGGYGALPGRFGRVPEQRAGAGKGREGKRRARIYEMPGSWAVRRWMSIPSSMACFLSQFGRHAKSGGVVGGGADT